MGAVESETSWSQLAGRIDFGFSLQGRQTPLHKLRHPATSLGFREKRHAESRSNPEP